MIKVTGKYKQIKRIRTTAVAVLLIIILAVCATSLHLNAKMRAEIAKQVAEMETRNSSIQTMQNATHDLAEVFRAEVATEAHIQALQSIWQELDEEKQNNLISIESLSCKAKAIPQTVNGYTDKDIDMICAVIQHEVGNCSKESKIAVTDLILNRVKSDRFPNSVHEVLHAKGQFTAIHNYYDNAHPITEETRASVMEAITNEDNANGALFYYAPKYVKNKKTIRWFESMDCVLELDGQRYFK